MPDFRSLHNGLRYSRRAAIQFATASLTTAAWLNPVFAQTRGNATGSFSPLNRFPRMIQEAFRAKMIAAERLGQVRRSAIASRADAESYIDHVRGLIRECFGPLPERTPLKPRILGVIDREQYRIEKVVFESRPGFLVSANLYVPKFGPFPRPGVVATCGHSNNGKSAEAYQSFAQGLARIGYVVLIFDPIGQGERLQYPDEALKSKIGAGVDEHLMLGNQQFLVGEFLGTWHVWDAIRSLDYLLTRDEVDPKRVGITGNSGGGTMTIWLCALEPRWTMAAPSCAVTTFRRNFENELPTDTEQCPPFVLQHGLDHVDFLAALAPKPVIILAAEKDYFDVRGAIETYNRLRPIYRWLGAEDQIRLFIGPNEHGYTQPNRVAMYNFFNEQTGNTTDQKEPQLTIEKDEALWCSPRGHIGDLGSKTVISITALISDSLRTDRGDLDSTELQKQVSSVIPERPDHAPEYAILRPIGQRGYPKPQATWYAIETEPDIRAIVCRLADKPHYSRPPAGAGRVILCVSHQSSDAELREEPLVKQLISDEPDSELYMVDLRGIGDSRPQTCGENQFLEPYGNDYFYAAHSIMLGRPYVAQRTFDLLRVIDWIKAQGRTEIHLAAVGWGTVPATLAAVLSDAVQQVTLKHALTSYSDIAESEEYDWPLSAFIPGVLKKFDLPDCYRALADKQLKLLEPRTALLRREPSL